MDKDGKWLIHSEADQSRNGEPLGFVPVVDLVLEKTGFFAGRPPLMELAYLNVKHWQSQSDQDNIVHYVSVPLLQYRGSEDVQNVVAAAGNMISVGADGELNYSGLNLNQDKATKPQTVQIVRQGEATPYWFKVNPL